MENVECRENRRPKQWQESGQRECHKDFEVYAAILASDTTNSGVCIRISEPKSITRINKYE